MDSPLVSICIPAYDRVAFLEKLLLNIEGQSFKNYEIVITDNSAHDKVKNLAASFADRLPINYKKNTPSVTMAENWNVCLDLARGTWIKFLHDDDFFSDAGALQAFVDAADADDALLFSSFLEFNNDTGITRESKYHKERIPQLSAHPTLILAQNVVGNPSCTFFRRDLPFRFDTRMKMMVDVAFYIQVLNRYPYRFIDQPLITVGFHEHQETNRVHRRPMVEIFEMLTVLQEQGDGIARHLLVYDAYWRLIRNHRIRSVAELEQYAQGVPIPAFIRCIIAHQRRLPGGLLRTGPFSKTAMMFSYLLNLKHLPSRT